MNGSDRDRWLDQLPVLTEIHQEEIKLARPFEEAAACFARNRGTVLLQSGIDLDCSRYHILALNPWLELKSRQERIEITCQDRHVAFDGDILALIQQLLDRYRIHPDESDLPVRCGLFGYLSYDLKDRIEKLPVTCMDTGLPDLYMVCPSAVLIHDKKTARTHLCIPVFKKGLS
ncbi:MAG: hypothetical protein MI702_08415, partial [Chlorobiales bacterium]|nr:hypothetical protein [Chlorobiales bacterium]